MSTIPLKDGIYIITNVKQRNSVFLENPDDETPLRGHYRQNNHSERWHVIDRGNGQHSIQNVGFQRYANSGPLAKLDAFVEGRGREQLWHVQECSKGKYTIATTDSGNFWMLPDNQLNTPVGLLDKPTDQRCWWTFTDADTGIPAKEDVITEATLFELEKLPILPFSPLKLDFVIVQQISDNSGSNASRTIGEIHDSLAPSRRPQLDTIRVNIIEFEPFEPGAISFRHFTGFCTVEKLCNGGGSDNSWKRCRGSSLPEMAMRGLRTDATKVALLNLNVTLLQQRSQAIIKVINSLVKRNITLILTPTCPTFYNNEVFEELRKISFESQPFKQMDEFSDYVTDYNETIALPRFIEYPELREAVRQALPRITGLLKDKDHETRLSAVTALSSLAEHVEHHDIIRQSMPNIMEVLKNEDYDVRSAAVAALSSLTENVCEGDIDAKDNTGRTPLSWAAGEGHEAVVCLLLDKNGVDVNAKDNFDNAPLSWAAWMGHDGVVRLLLDHNGVEVGAKGNNGFTPLSNAAVRGHNEVAKLLLAHEGVDVNSKSKAGRTPLSYAAAEGHEEVVKLLLEHEGVDVDSKSKDGRTPLSYAAVEGREEVVKLFLEHGGVDVNSKSDAVGTPLVWAANRGHGGVVRLLLAHKHIEINAKSTGGRTALSTAAAEGHEQVVKLLLEHKGVDFNSKSDAGEIPLVRAAARGHGEVIRLLLAHQHIEVDAKSTGGSTALSTAATEGHEQVVKLLLAHEGVDVNSRNDAGATPLLCAAYRGHGGVVRLLLAHKNIDVNVKNNGGWTPLSLAKASGHDEVVQLLRMRV